MKLCPQCEFIYEDDQSFCDMDGGTLVYDTRLGGLPGTVPAVTGARPTKSRLRIIAVPVSAGLVLSALLSISYYARSPLLDPNVQFRGLKPEAPETSVSQQSAQTPAKSLSQAVTNPPQSPTNPETAPESGSMSAELPDTPAQPSARRHIVSKTSNDGIKTSNHSLGISRHVPPLPRLTPLPGLPPPRRLPAAKPGAKLPVSTTPQPQGPTSQKLAVTSQKALVVDVKPARSSTNTRSRVGTFLKKTGRVLQKPFKF